VKDALIYTREKRGMMALASGGLRQGSGTHAFVSRSGDGANLARIWGFLI